MALITTTELGNYINKTLATDSRATQVVSAVNQWVETYLGRYFGVEAGGKTLTEVLDYTPVIFLDAMDIVSIDEVKLFGTTLTSTEYVINNTTGRLVLSTSGSTPRVNNRSLYDAVEVTYKAGVETVPADLKLAVLQLASENYNKRDTADNSNISSTSVGGFSVSFGTSTSSDNTTQPDGSHAVSGYMAVLNAYKRHRI